MVSEGIDLHHHGDSDIDPDLIDLAVNVRLPAPPQWLAQIIADSVSELGAYPDPRQATAALAAHHCVPLDHVLPTAGGAEAFTLIARGLPGDRPCIIHPQFTEPDTALRAAGRTPTWTILEAPEFTLDPDAVPADADLVMIGNPTNPTGTLHPRATLDRLRRPGRIVVVDEAFADAVPGEPETMIGGDMTGVLVLRSLTKTWGIAGLRAGYVVGDPALIAQLATQQPHWSVSTPALAVMAAVCSDRGRAETAAAADLFDTRRAHLVAALAEAGFPVAGRPRTPFVLVRVGEGVREVLREHGFAVRRGDTFPGLGPEWIRIAVRDEATSDALVNALRAVG